MLTLDKISKKQAEVEEQVQRIEKELVAEMLKTRDTFAPEVFQLLKVLLYFDGQLELIKEFKKEFQNENTKITA